MKKSLKAFSLLMAAGMLVLSGCGQEKSSGSSSEGNEKKQYTIGITQFVEHPSLDAATEGFKKALEDEGFKEGDNVKFDFQNAQADMNNTQTIANNFVGDKVDMIFANATPSAVSALNATKDIPILFTSVQTLLEPVLLNHLISLEIILQAQLITTRKELLRPLIL